MSTDNVRRWYCDEDPVLCEDEDRLAGDYVLFSDYAKLEASHAALVDVLNSMCGMLDDAQAEAIRAKIAVALKLAEG